MRIYLDDDLDSNRLIGLLKNEGHAVVSPREVGMRGATDLKHLQYASQNGLVLLTANVSDFLALHSKWIESKLPIRESSSSIGRTTRSKILLLARSRRLLLRSKGPDSLCWVLCTTLVPGASRLEQLEVFTVHTPCLMHQHSIHQLDSQSRLQGDSSPNAHTGIVSA